MRIREVQGRLAEMRGNDDMTLNTKTKHTFVGRPGIVEGPDLPLSDWAEDTSLDIREPGDWKNVEFGSDGEPVRIPNQPVRGGIVSERFSSSI
jgi:hypothetical protein